MNAILAVGFAVLVAHGGTAAQETDYRPELDGLSPAVEGVGVRLVDDGTRIELDAGDHEVVVLGYEGEPFLLVDEGGVFENVLSPSTYLNRSLEGETPPPEASFDSEPRWEQLDDGRVVRWHDHALHVPPGQQLGTRTESRWSVSLRIDGADATIDGRIVTLPDVSALPWVALAAVVAAAVIVSLRVSGQRTTMALLALLVAADAARLYGIVLGTPTWLASRWEVISEELTLSLVGSGMAIAAIVLHARRRTFEAAAGAIVAGAVLALAGGLLELDDLASPGLSSALPDGMARAMVAVVLGAGVGVTARGLLELRRVSSRPARRAPRSGSAPSPADGTRTASRSNPASG